MEDLPHTRMAGNVLAELDDSALYPESAAARCRNQSTLGPELAAKASFSKKRFDREFIHKAPSFPVVGSPKRRRSGWIPYAYAYPHNTRTKASTAVVATSGQKTGLNDD